MNPLFNVFFTSRIKQSCRINPRYIVSSHFSNPSIFKNGNKIETVRY